MNVSFSLNELGNIIITAGLVLAALAAAMRLVRSPLRSWLGVKATPEDVFQKLDNSIETKLDGLGDKLDEVVTNQASTLNAVTALLAVVLNGPAEEPSDEEIAEAREVLRRAGELNE